jgi:hypothetical protein
MSLADIPSGITAFVDANILTYYLGYLLPISWVWHSYIRFWPHILG